jgi:hypothetical protein
MRALFKLMVLLTTVRTADCPLQIPPPEPELRTVFPLIVLFSTVSVPPFVIPPVGFRNCVAPARRGAPAHRLVRVGRVSPGQSRIGDV